MGFARRGYQPRHAETSVLHIVIREHLDNFLRAAADRADGAAVVIQKILAHVGLPGTRDGPRLLSALSVMPAEQPALPGVTL